MYFIRRKKREKKFYLEMAVLKLSSVLGGFAEKFALKGITKFEVEPRRLLPQKLETTTTPHRCRHRPKSAFQINNFKITMES